MVVRLLAYVDKGGILSTPEKVSKILVEKIRENANCSLKFHKIHIFGKICTKIINCYRIRVNSLILEQILLIILEGFDKFLAKS